MRTLWLILAVIAIPAFAVEPDEMLSDPVLEQRARALSSELRCPVCQNENIDESNAQLSRDLRLVLRERLVAGDSDEQAVSFLVRRYGEFILLKPNTDGANVLLWLAGPLLLILAGAIGYGTIRARNRSTPEPLTAQEQAALDKILKS